MGKYMEKMIQNPVNKFRGRYLIKPGETKADNVEDEPDYFNYTRCEGMLMRS